MPVDWRQDEFIAAVRRGALRGLIIAANDVRNEILRRILQTAKTGKVYIRRGIEHQASAPGEAPASDTGTLARNITVMVDPQALTAKINSGAAHSWYLEFGTLTIEPRPHLRVSLAAQKDNIPEIVGREISIEIAGMGSR
jgi:hypothetical protein